MHEYNYLVINNNYINMNKFELKIKFIHFSTEYDLHYFFIYYRREFVIECMMVCRICRHLLPINSPII